MTKPILFVSSNGTWGGSEILWSDTALLLAEHGYKIKFALKFNNPIIQKLKNKGATYINLNQAYPSFFDRTLIKVRLKHSPNEPFLQAVLEDKPQLVVISQGNNVDGKYYMTVCRERGIPYITVTQLVTNILWVFINDDIINELRAGYAHAIRNYFVSQDNLDMHNLMIGEKHPNSKIILNPFTVPVEVPYAFPRVIDDRYEIALVGRLETFHKGQDLLLQVLQQPKWKQRPVTFNFYGTGPHKMLLERLVKEYEIINVVFKGHIQDVARVWEHNHLLILPSRMEGQSLALIEAMWCHRGAIVTNLGGASELITDEETGFMAMLPTVSDLDNTLERAWNLRHKWEEMGKNAGKKVRQIFQTNPIDDFEKEIKNLVEEPLLKLGK